MSKGTEVVGGGREREKERGSNKLERREKKFQPSKRGGRRKEKKRKGGKPRGEKERMVSRGFEPRIQDSKSWVLTTTLQDPRGCNALHTTLITRSRNNNRLPSSFAQLSICSFQSTQPHTLMSQFESFITFSKTNTIYSFQPPELLRPECRSRSFVLLDALAASARNGFQLHDADDAKNQPRMPNRCGFHP